MLIGLSATGYQLAASPDAHLPERMLAMPDSSITFNSKGWLSPHKSWKQNTGLLPNISALI